MDLPQCSDSGIQLPIRPQGIAFDLDGTLLDYDGPLSDSVARAVGLIANAGIKEVFLVTGRLQSGCEEYWKKLGLDTPVATCNGAAVGFFDQKPFLHAPLSSRARDVILDLDAGLLGEVGKNTLLQSCDRSIAGLVEVDDLAADGRRTT